MEKLRSWPIAALRWYGAYLCGWGIYELIVLMYEKESVMLALVLSLGAAALLITTGLLLLPELLTFVASPLIMFIDSIYLPNDREAKAPLDYRLAEHYEARGQYGELAEAYERLLQYYPREARLYRGLVELYETVLPRPFRARWLRFRARLELSREAYKALCDGA